MSHRDRGPTSPRRTGIRGGSGTAGCAPRPPAAHWSHGRRRHRPDRIAAAGGPARGPRPGRCPHLRQGRGPVSRGPGADHRARPRQPRLGRRRQRVRRVRLGPPRGLARTRPSTRGRGRRRGPRSGRQLRPPVVDGGNGRGAIPRDGRLGHGQVRPQRVGRHHGRRQAGAGGHRARPGRDLRGPAVLLDRRLVHRAHRHAGGDPAGAARPHGCLPVQRPGLRAPPVRGAPGPGRVPRPRAGDRRRAGARLPRGAARAVHGRGRPARVRRDDHRLPLGRGRGPARLRRAPGPHDVRQGDGQRVRDRRARRPARAHGAGRHPRRPGARVPAVHDPRRRDDRAGRDGRRARHVRSGRRDRAPRRPRAVPRDRRARGHPPARPRGADPRHGAAVQPRVRDARRRRPALAAVPDAVPPGADRARGDRPVLRGQRGPVRRGHRPDGRGRRRGARRLRARARGRRRPAPPRPPRQAGVPTRSARSDPPARA